MGYSLVGSLKGNVDASFIIAEAKACLGLMVGDHNGVVVLSARKNVRGVHCTLHVEIHAILFGLEVIHNYGLIVPLFESDCRLAIMEVNKGVNSYS